MTMIISQINLVKAKSILLKPTLWMQFFSLLLTFKEKIMFGVLAELVKTVPIKISSVLHDKPDQPYLFYNRIRKIILI